MTTQAIPSAVLTGHLPPVPSQQSSRPASQVGSSGPSRPASPPAGETQVPLPPRLLPSGSQQSRRKEMAAFGSPPSSEPAKVPAEPTGTGETLASSPDPQAREFESSPDSGALPDDDFTGDTQFHPPDSKASFPAPTRDTKKSEGRQPPQVAQVRDDEALSDHLEGLAETLGMCLEQGELLPRTESTLARDTARMDKLVGLVQAGQSPVFVRLHDGHWGQGTIRDYECSQDKEQLVCFVEPCPDDQADMWATFCNPDVSKPIATLLGGQTIKMRGDEVVFAVPESMLSVEEPTAEAEPPKPGQALPSATDPGARSPRSTVFGPLHALRRDGKDHQPARLEELQAKVGVKGITQTIQAAMEKRSAEPRPRSQTTGVDPAQLMQARRQLLASTGLGLEVQMADGKWRKAFVYSHIYQSTEDHLFVYMRPRDRYRREMEDTYERDPKVSGPIRASLGADAIRLIYSEKVHAVPEERLRQLPSRRAEDSYWEPSVSRSAAPSASDVTRTSRPSPRASVSVATASVSSPARRSTTAPELTATLPPASTGPDEGCCVIS